VLAEVPDGFSGVPREHIIVYTLIRTGRQARFESCAKERESGSGADEPRLGSATLTTGNVWATRYKLLRTDDAAADGIEHQAGGLVDVEFLHQPGAMRLRGFDADAEQGSDILGGFSFGDELQDLAFSWR